MRRPTKSGLKRKLDKAFSQLVRSRGKCEWCGAKNDTLQTAHIFSRKYMSVRYEPLNVLCLCASCHFKAHAQPINFTLFVQKYLGAEKFAELQQKAQKIKKWTLQDLQTLLESLNDQVRQDIGRIR